MPGHLGNMAATVSSLSIWSVQFFFHNTIDQAYYIILSSHQEKQIGMWSYPFSNCPPHHRLAMPDWLPSTYLAVPSSTPSTLCILVTTFPISTDVSRTWICLKSCTGPGANHHIAGDDHSPDNPRISEDGYAVTHIIYQGAPCQSTTIRHVPHTQKR